VNRWTCAGSATDWRHCCARLSRRIRSATRCSALSAGGHDKLKIPYWNRNGFVVWYKLIEGKEKFHCPRRSEEAVVTLTGEQLGWLIEGYDVSKMKPHRALETRLLQSEQKNAELAAQLEVRERINNALVTELEARNRYLQEQTERQQRQLRELEDTKRHYVELTTVLKEELAWFKAQVYGRDIAQVPIQFSPGACGAALVSTGSKRLLHAAPIRACPNLRMPIPPQP
jgi:hypothetical protein